MTKAINQNDLIDIIKSELEKTTDLVSVIIAISDEMNKIDGNIRKKIYMSSNEINSILEKIAEMSDYVNQVNSIKLNPNPNGINNIVSIISQWNTQFEKINTDNITSNFDFVKIIAEKMAAIEIKDINYSNILSCIECISKLFTALQIMPINESVLTTNVVDANIKVIDKIVNDFKNINDLIDKLPDFDNTNIKNLNNVSELISVINTVSNMMVSSDIKGLENIDGFVNNAIIFINNINAKISNISSFDKNTVLSINNLCENVGKIKELMKSISSININEELNNTKLIEQNTISLLNNISKTVDAISLHSSNLASMNIGVRQLKKFRKVAKITPKILSDIMIELTHEFNYVNDISQNLLNNLFGSAIKTEEIAQKIDNLNTYPDATNNDQKLKEQIKKSAEQKQNNLLDVFGTYIRTIETINNLDVDLSKIKTNSKNISKSMILVLDNLMELFEHKMIVDSSMTTITENASINIDNICSLIEKNVAGSIQNMSTNINIVSLLASRKYLKYLINTIKLLYTEIKIISDYEKLTINFDNLQMAVNDMLNIIQRISQTKINISNLLLFQLSAQKIKTQMSLLLNNIEELFPDNKQVLISKKRLNSLIEFSNTIISVSEKLKEFCNNLLPYTVIMRIVNKGLRQTIIDLYYGDNDNDGLAKILYKQLSYFNNEEFEIIANTSKNIKIVSDNIKDTLLQFNSIIEEIIKSKWLLNFKSKKYNPLIILETAVNSFIEFAKNLNKKLDHEEFNYKNVKNLSQYILEIKNLINSIKSITLNIIALGLLLPVMILAVPLALGTIAMVKLFLNSITWLLMVAPTSVMISCGLKDLTNSVLMIALSMLVVAATLVMVALTGPIIAENAGRTALIMLAVLGMVALIGVVLWLAIKARIFTMVIKGTGQLMLAVLVICGSILAVAGTILLTSLIADTVVNNIKPFLKMFGVTMLIIVGAVAIALVAATIAAPVFIGLAAIGLTVLGLMGITLLISELAKPKYDVSQHEDAVKKNVKSIKDIISTILTTLFNGGLLGNNNNVGNRGLIGAVLNFVSPSLYSLYEMITTFAFLSTTLLSVGALILIGDLLGKVASIEIDPTSIKNKIQDIVECVQDLIKTVTAPYELKPGEKGLLGSLINWLAPEIGHVVDAASSMMVLGLSVVSVGALGMIAKTLSSIQNIQLDKEALVGKNGSVHRILSVADSVIDSIGSYKEGSSKRVYKQAKKKVKIIESVVKSLGIINEALNQIYSNNISYSNVLPGVVSLITNDDFKKAITDIANNKGLNRDTVNKSNYYKTILKNIYGNLPDFTLDDKLAKNSIGVTNKYIEFIDKIDKVNLEKLQTSVKMFEKMADFSKSINGNFEKLAESINEDLMPVLEELKETLNKIPEKIDTNAASVSASVAAYSSPMAGPTTPWEMTAQVNRENPSMSPEEVKEVVDTRLNEQARAQSQSLEYKFDELIELLKSGMARVSLT